MSDRVPHEASLPKAFSTGDDSSLLARESSSMLHSTVSSTRVPSEIVMVDEETRMSADTSSRAHTPAKQVCTSTFLLRFRRIQLTFLFNN